jgi:protein TonB
MARRRIGRSAAEAAPDTTMKTDAVQVQRTQEEVTPGAVATESVQASVPVTPPSPPEPARGEEPPSTKEPPAAKEPVAVTPAPAPTKIAFAMVPPATLKGLLASNTTIEPADNVQHQMMRDEVKRASSVIKVCIAADGAVATTAVARSSGYPAYDQQLVAGVRAWRYRPYMVNGQPTPACSAVAFAFTIQ